MAKALYKISDRELLKSLATSHGAFHRPDVILDGLTEEQAKSKPHSLPHSIADIVGHMCFWQDLFNRAAMEGLDGFPEHARESWPEMPAGGWDDLRARFLASVEKAQELALTCDRLDEPFLPEGVPIAPLERESTGSGLLHAAVHNSHHLGQIVTMRRLIGLWPPGAGSMTW